MSSPSKVTAVLITREKKWPDDINPDWRLGELNGFPNSPFDEVLVETECVGVHRRFELAMQARNDVIYVQDDDCAIDVMRLWRRFEADHASRLTYAITAGHKSIYDDLCGSAVCLIGWGCFFPKRLADPARWQPYRDRFGEIPSHEADRVFTYFARPHQPVVMPISMRQRTRAMSRDNTEHYRSRDRIIKQLMEIT